MIGIINGSKSEEYYDMLVDSIKEFTKYKTKTQYKNKKQNWYVL